jgi:hypothetical protein
VAKNCKLATRHRYKQISLSFHRTRPGRLEHKVFLQDITRKISGIYHEYPRTLWIVFVISFIDHIGGTLIFPFFALYLTSKFDAGMTQAGVPFATFLLSGFGGSAIGGEITDRLGRMGIIIFGLFVSSFSALATSFATTFQISAGLVEVPMPAEAI